MPEIGVVEQHIAIIAIDRDFAGHFLEAQRHVEGWLDLHMSPAGACAVGQGHVVGVAERRRRRPAMAAGHDTQEAVRRACAVDMDREGRAGPDVQLRSALPVTVPADALVA